MKVHDFFYRRQFYSRFTGAPLTSVPAADYPSIRRGRDDRTLSFGQQQARNGGDISVRQDRKRAYDTYGGIVVGALIRH